MRKNLSTKIKKTILNSLGLNIKLRFVENVCEILFTKAKSAFEKEMEGVYKDSFLDSYTDILNIYQKYFIVFKTNNPSEVFNCENLNEFFISNNLEELLINFQELLEDEKTITNDLLIESMFLNLVEVSTNAKLFNWTLSKLLYCFFKKHFNNNILSLKKSAKTIYIKNISKKNIPTFEQKVEIYKSFYCLLNIQRHLSQRTNTENVAHITYLLEDFFFINIMEETLFPLENLDIDLLKEHVKIRITKSDLDREA